MAQEFAAAAPNVNEDVEMLEEGQPAPPPEVRGGMFDFEDPGKLKWPTQFSNECNAGLPMYHHFMGIQRFKKVLSDNLRTINAPNGSEMDNAGILYVHQTGTGKTNLVLWLMNVCAACRIPFRVVTTKATLGKYADNAALDDFTSQSRLVDGDGHTFRVGESLWNQNRTHWIGPAKGEHTSRKSSKFDQVTIEELVGTDNRRIEKTYLENGQNRGYRTKGGGNVGEERYHALEQPHVLFVDEMQEIMMQYHKEGNNNGNVDEFIRWCTKSLNTGITRGYVIVVGFTATPGASYSDLQTLINCVASNGNYHINELEDRTLNGAVDPLQQGIRSGVRNYVDFADLTLHPAMPKPNVRLQDVTPSLSDALLYNAFLFKDMQRSCKAKSDTGRSLNMLYHLEKNGGTRQNVSYENTMLADMELITGDRAQTNATGLQMEFLSNEESDASAGALVGMLPIAYYSDALNERRNNQGGYGAGDLLAAAKAAPGTGPGCLALKKRVRELFEARGSKVGNTVEQYLRFVARNDMDTQTASVGSKLSTLFANLQERTAQIKRGNARGGMSLVYIRDEPTTSALFEFLKWVYRRKARISKPEIFSAYKVAVWSPSGVANGAEQKETADALAGTDNRGGTGLADGLRGTVTQRKKGRKAYNQRTTVDMWNKGGKVNSEFDTEVRNEDERRRGDAARDAPAIAPETMRRREGAVRHPFAYEEGDIIFIRMKEIIGSNDEYAERIKIALARSDWSNDPDHTSKHVVVVLSGRDEGVGLSFPQAEEMHILDVPPSRSAFLQLLGRPLRLCGRQADVRISLYKSSTVDPVNTDEDLRFQSELLYGQRCFQYNRFIITKPFEEVDPAPYRFQQSIRSLCQSLATTLIDQSESGRRDVEFALKKRPAAVRKLVYYLLPYYLAMQYWPSNTEYVRGKPNIGYLDEYTLYMAYANAGNVDEQYNTPLSLVKADSVAFGNPQDPALAVYYRAQNAQDNPLRLPFKVEEATANAIAQGNQKFSFNIFTFLEKAQNDPRGMERRVMEVTPSGPIVNRLLASHLLNALDQTSGRAATKPTYETRQRRARPNSAPIRRKDAAAKVAERVAAALARTAAS